MKILLTGSSGLIGDYIAKNFPDKSQLLIPSKKEFDITRDKSIDNFFSRFKPDIVIHSAGATGILNGEKERGNKKGVFWRTNVLGSKRLVLNCKKNKSFLLYFSGEVVFGGVKSRPGPYKENDLPDRSNKYLSWYGQTKKEAEGIIRQSLPFYAIVRLGSVVGSGRQPRPDYLRKILQSYKVNKLSPMFDNQFISLAENRDVLTVVDKLINKKNTGTFHVASSDRFTPYELSKYILMKIYGLGEVVVPSKIEDFLKTDPSTFPQFSGLSTQTTVNTLGIRFSTWKSMIDNLTGELKILYKL